MRLINKGVYPCHEYGSMPGAGEIDPLRDANGSLAYYRDDMVGNAIAEARKTLAALIDDAIDTAIDGQGAA